MADGYYQRERECSECGERFWGTAGANFCRTACRCRAWRKKRAARAAVTVAELCAEVTRRRMGGGEAPSKLYPRLFRALAAELRKSGWDPIELLMTLPDDPATDSDTEAPGGVEGTAPNRRRWLHPPDVEIERLKERMRERAVRGWPTAWFESRIRQLQKVLDAQG